MKFYVTFGQKYFREPHPVFWGVQELPNRLWRVEAEDLEDAIAQVQSRIGKDYSSVYTAEKVDPTGTTACSRSTGTLTHPRWS